MNPIANLVLVVAFVMLLGLLPRASLAQTEQHTGEDRAAEFHLLAQGFREGKLLLFLLASYRNYDEIMVLSRSGSSGTFEVATPSLEKSRIDEFAAKHSLRPVQMSVASVRWDDKKQAFEGSFEVFCESESMIKIPFAWSDDKGLLVEREEKWEVQEVP